MEFKIDFTETDYYGSLLDTDDINLDEYADDEQRATALYSYIVLHAHEEVGSGSLTLGSIVVEEIYGSDGSGGDSIEPYGDLMAVCTKMVKLWNVESESDTELDKMLALISNQGWEWYDFDNKYWGECVRYEVDEGDYEQVAKEERESRDDSCLDEVWEFIDKDAWGRHIVENDYEEITFNGKMYVVDK